VLVLDGEHPVEELAFTPDGTRLVTAHSRSWPAEVWPCAIWTVATGARVELTTPQAKVPASFAIHSSGRFAFLAQGGPLVVASLADGTGRPVAGADGADTVLASRGGNWVVAASRIEDTWDWRFCGYRCEANAQPGCALRWRAEPHIQSERLGGFVGTGEQFVTVGRHRIVVRDTETGAVKTTVRYAATYGACPVAAPDGARFAVRSSTQFYLWKTATWGTPLRIASEGRPLYAYAFHPTRSILGAIQEGQTLVKFLDADTGKVVSKYRWKLGEMRSICFSPDGTLAAAGSASGKIVVWDLE
jgi:WD40 repeat protein